jgi:archaemetzincin
MIHVVTLEPFTPEETREICRALFAAYGIGAEHTAEFKVPEEATLEGGLDAEQVALKAESPKLFGDDKILYLLKRPFRPRPSPVGNLPTHGFAAYGGSRAAMSAALVTQGVPTPEAQALRLAKLSVHTVGHLFDLHHCVDARCSMAVPWGPSFAQGQTADLCSFCREKSERHMKNDAA